MKDLFDEFHKIRLTMVKVVINELFVYSKISLKYIALNSLYWQQIITFHLFSTQIFGAKSKSRKPNPQKLTQLSSRSHPRHLVGKKTAQKDTIIDITSDSQVNSNFPYRLSPASLTFNNYFYLFLCLYIT